MLSKAQIKHITALRTKKNRTEHAQFIVEGKKSVTELLKSSYTILHVYYLEEHQALFESSNLKNKTMISNIEMSKISSQKNPEGVLAVGAIPAERMFSWSEERYIALDKIRDPGNLGTIVRLADWFGIRTVLCSMDCVDAYNPKVIQASMGSLFNVQVEYINLALQLSTTNLPKYAATMQGASVYTKKPQDKGILVIGNEANGISEAVKAVCNEQVSIPSKGKAESLNAAMACGILCSHFFR